MKKIIRKVATITVAFAVAFTAFPIATSSFSVDAYAKKQSKKITLSASAAGQSAASLSWNKIFGAKGYAVFRDGAARAYLGKGTKSYSDAGLSAGSTHSYQIKSYTKKVKKTKMWKNKYTGALRKKKPSKKDKKNWKKVTIKKTTYKYGKKSNVRYVTTAAPAVASSPASSSGSTGSGSGTGSTGSGNNTSAPETKTVTDYLGVTRTLTKQTDGYGNEYWFDAEDSAVYSDTDMVALDRTLNGEFTSRGTTMFQQDGATFIKSDLWGQGDAFGKYETTSTQEGDYHDTDYGFSIDMWGDDVSKLTYEIDHDIVDVNTYTQISGVKEYTPVTRKYIKSSTGNSYLTRVMQIDIGKPKGYGTSVAATGNYRMVFNFKDPDRSVCCGLESEDVTITIKYNGNKIGEIVWNPTEKYFGKKIASVNGMSATKALAWDIAQAAIEAAGGPSTNANSLLACAEDLHTIEQYFYNTYTYGETISGYGTSFTAGCEGGALVLETYSIKKYQQFGFWGAGNQDASSSHSSWNFNSDPSTYFETQGH